MGLHESRKELMTLPNGKVMGQSLCFRAQRRLVGIALFRRVDLNFSSQTRRADAF
jgi:hypothetical protein